MKHQKGITMVEFTLVAAVLFVIIFGCIELGRAAYTLAALNEGTRRAARLAAVCPINDPKIAAAVNFMNIYGFDPTSNVAVNYLDTNGAALGASPSLNSVYYVQVQIQGYSVPLAIPFLNVSIASPSFTATLPAESLGISLDPVTKLGVSTAC